MRHRKKTAYGHLSDLSLFSVIWKYIWEPPVRSCPKCGGNNIEYYDPFFFSPLRTIQGKRRFLCQTCHFIWRPSSGGGRKWHFFRNLS